MRDFFTSNLILVQLVDPSEESDGAASSAVCAAGDEPVLVVSAAERRLGEAEDHRVEVVVARAARPLPPAEGKMLVGLVEMKFCGI